MLLVDACSLGFYTISYLIETEKLSMKDEHKIKTNFCVIFDYH